MAASPSERDKRSSAAKPSAEVGAGISRALLDGAVRVLELVLLAGGASLAVAALLGLAFHRGYGAMAVFVCVLVGGVMIFGGFMTRTGAGLARNKRRRQRQLERAREQLKDPAARARAEAEARIPQTYISQGGITAVAGFLIIVLGFVVDAIVGTT